MAIDIGPGASNRASSVVDSFTRIDLGNPSNSTGYLDTVQVYSSIFMNGIIVGTFYGSGTSWTCRDHAHVANIASDGLRTYTGLNIAVELGDCLGIYFSSGSMDSASSGGAGYLSVAGDQSASGVQTYTLTDSDGILSIAGSGVETVPAGVKTMNSLAIASVKTMNSLAIASVKTLKGI